MYPRTGDPFLIYTRRRRTREAREWLLATARGTSLAGHLPDPFRAVLSSLDGRVVRANDGAADQSRAAATCHMKNRLPDVFAALSHNNVSSNVAQKPQIRFFH